VENDRHAASAASGYDDWRRDIDAYQQAAGARLAKTTKPLVKA
jgi:hypothetical protein